MFLWLLLLAVNATDSDPAWAERAIDHCENVFQVSELVYSGGEPQGEAAFRALSARGVRTIVSVDGARPDVETAKAFGIRYVHLPIGYEGVSRHRGLQFGRIIADANAPVYFHCHHGRHRGPAAVAAGMEAAGRWLPGEARAFLAAAGTSEAYSGLSSAIETFERATAAELAAVNPDFPEIAVLAPLQECMAGIDRRKDHLARSQAAGWVTPPAHPDVSPVHEALQLRELFEELMRLDTGPDRPEAYQQRMKGALQAAAALEKALQAGEKALADRAFEALAASCTDCHAPFRDAFTPRDPASGPPN